MLVMQVPKLEEVLESWRGLMRVGIPVMATNVLGPIATAMLTTIVALYGSGAVAAYGIGARMEGLVLIPVLALSSGLSPFIGQNWGHTSRRAWPRALSSPSSSQRHGASLRWRRSSLVDLILLRSSQKIPLFKKTSPSTFRWFRLAMGPTGR